ncbi:metal-sensitive transcriptional regulator [Bacillus inaquosorum]|nr:metal-sensitive transcriptional regulator [Bacillus inaquosorum]
MKNRLRRIEGQIKGVLTMMEQGKDCREVVTQLATSRNAIDRAMGLIVSTNLEHCVRESLEKGEDTQNLVKEAVDLLVRVDKKFINLYLRLTNFYMCYIIPLPVFNELNNSRSFEKIFDLDIPHG